MCDPTVGKTDAHCRPTCSHIKKLPTAGAAAHNEAVVASGCFAIGVESERVPKASNVWKRYTSLAVCLLLNLVRSVVADSERVERYNILWL